MAAWEPSCGLRFGGGNEGRFSVARRSLIARSASGFISHSELRSAPSGVMLPRKIRMGWPRSRPAASRGSLGEPLVESVSERAEMR